MAKTICTIFAFALLVVSYVVNVNSQQPPKFNFDPPKQPNNDFKVFGGGGGSSKQGLDLNLGAQTKLWESQNGRNTLHGTGTYSQHLGGPYGNSKPNFGGGVTFTHHFG
ncbi:diptericin-D-like [Condylostylus longicornis]|uniref:diptericin-D-like n=1 Tax=Condylostylus longicornis TaxID=2530218 RepID=UPI00244E492A|nr:diptericin-D-like [Condylostylus longicornis]